MLRINRRVRASLPVPIGRVQLCTMMECPDLLADKYDSDPRRRHQTFLAGADKHIKTPGGMFMGSQANEAMASTINNAG